MREKKILAYLLYITLLEIRESAYAENNSRLYHLTDMLHNVPFSLLEEDTAKVEYSRVLEAVEKLGVTEWLESRMEEFGKRFPESSF